MVYLSNVRGEQATTLPYVRPPEWLALPALTNGVQMLKAVTPGNNFFVLRVVCTGNFTVNWGDGNTINYASNTQVNYNYDYSTISAGTEFRGYRQALITITGTNITAVTLNLKHSDTASNIPNESGILDFQLEIPTLTTLGMGLNTTTHQLHRMCEQVYIGANALTSSDSLFSRLASLRKATFTVPSNSLSASRLFSECASLTDVIFIGDKGARVTALSETFQNCTSLVKAPFLNTSSTTNWDKVFSGCTNLQYVPQYNKTGGNMVSIFTNCTRLERVPFWDTAGVTSFLDCFSGCSSLESVPLYDTASVTSFQSMVSGCRSLESIPQFSTANGTVFQYMFSGCTRLKAVPLLNTSKATNMRDMFNSCQSLVTVPALVTSAVTNAIGMFSGCNSLKYIPNLNFAALNSSINAGSIFSNCNSLSRGATTGIRFSVSYVNCQLSQSALVDIFNGLGTASGSQTIAITGNPGAAGLTAGERAIATGKGWTITG